MLAAALPSDLSASHDLLHALLNVSLPGIVLLRPVYAVDDPTVILDLVYVHLNPAAQQMLDLPAQPSDTFLTLYPNAIETGIFAFYRDTFLSGTPGEYSVNYPFDRLNNFFLLSAQRSGELLVVGFTDTATQDRSQVEQALRESQAHEQAAHTAAEQEKSNVLRLFEQVTIAMALFQGPDYIIELANLEMHYIWGRTPAQTLGRPVFDALPEIAGQGFEDIFAAVLQHGTPYDLQDVPVQIDRGHTNRPTLGYFHLMYRPQYNAQGSIMGIITMAVEVTEQVLARQQLEQLNQELEVRVEARTREVQAIRSEAERQRRQWEQLFLRAPAAICIFDGPDWVYEFVNPGYQAMFPGRALLGKRLVDALPEVADQPLMQILHGVYNTGEPFEGREVLVPLARTEGGPVEDIYFDLTYLARYNDQGQIDGFITYAYDVTQQVLARREREQRQQQLHELFEQAPVAIAIFRGPRYVIELANPTVCALWGRTPAQAVGKPLFDLLPETADQGFEQLLDRVMATGEPYVAHELPATIDRHGQRETVYWNFVYQPLRGSDGRTTAVTVVSTEVTEQVRARRQLEQLNQELEARVQERTREVQAARAAAERQRGELERVFEQAPVAIAVFRGPNYIIELANPTIARLWGRTREQLIGRGVYEAMPEGAGMGYEQLMDEVMNTGVPYAAHAMESQYGRNGRLDTLYWDFVYVPMYAADGRSNGVMVVATDTTAQVEARRQMEQLNQELEARVQERTRQLTESNQQLTRTNIDLDTFIYTASHDLKAPITNIEGILLALRAQLPPEVQQEEMVSQLLHMLQGTVTRFQLTINQLTDITKLQLAHAGPAEPVRLAQVVEDVRLDLAPLIEAAAAALTVEVEPALEVSFSPANLRSIVYNLLSNAVKYRSPNRPIQVVVRADATPQAVVLTVQDNGLGMSEVQQRQLFGLFQRLHTHVEGTGVGLYIVKRLVENGGGTIAVQSQTNVGTTFIITFPHPKT